MREIKFRAWDEQAKLMHEDFRYIKSGNEGNDWIIFTSVRQTLQGKQHPFENPYFQDQFKIMQYTGLKDGNGVEIYEGDIVNLWYAPQAVAIGFISFDNGGFVFNTKKAVPNKAFIGDCVDSGNSFTVIGNIYQNSDLLS